MNDIESKIAAMRKKLNLPPFDGNMDRLKLRIQSLTIRLGQKTEVEPEPKKTNTNFNDKLLSLKSKKL
jgi:hypothetical protein